MSYSVELVFIMKMLPMQLEAWNLTQCWYFFLPRLMLLTVEVHVDLSVTHVPSVMPEESDVMLKNSILDEVTLLVFQSLFVEVSFSTKVSGKSLKVLATNKVKSDTSLGLNIMFGLRR